MGGDSSPQKKRWSNCSEDCYQKYLRICCSFVQCKCDKDERSLWACTRCHTNVTICEHVVLRCPCSTAIINQWKFYCKDKGVFGGCHLSTLEKSLIEAILIDMSEDPEEIAFAVQGFNL